MSATTVTVYGVPGCQGCRLTVRELTRRGVQVEVVDLTTSASARELIEAMDFTSAPIVAAGGRWWQGMRPDLIKETVQLAGRG